MIRLHRTLRFYSRNTEAFNFSRRSPHLAPLNIRPGNLNIRLLTARFFAAHADTQDRDKQPVLVSRVSEDYVENTLTPHLEGQILYNIHVYGPLELSRIARGYSMIPIRQKLLCRKLSEQIKFRMVMFSGMSLVETIGAMWVLLPEDEELFEMLGERIVDVIDDFNALNLIGIIRIYNKLQHYEILSILVPRLQELLREYDDAELMDMMVALAHAGTAVQDMDVLVCLVPEIIRRFDDIPLQVKLTHLWCMTKLRIVHEDMLALCAKDLLDTKLTRGMPAPMVCRTLWVFARSGALDMVLPAMEKLVTDNLDSISCADFARLAQILMDTQSKQSGRHLKLRAAGDKKIGQNPNGSNAEESQKQIPSASSTTGGIDGTDGGKKSDSEDTMSSESQISESELSESQSTTSNTDLTTKDINSNSKQPLPMFSSGSQVPAKLSNKDHAESLLRQVADKLQDSSILLMGRKEVVLYLLGCVRCDFLDREDLPDIEHEKSLPMEKRRTDKLYQIFAYFYEEQDNFERDEIERIVTALWFHQEYRILIDLVPKSWTTFVDEILVALEARAEQLQYEAAKDAEDS